MQKKSYGKLGTGHTLTKMYHWFYTDVIASSSPAITTRDQVHKIMILNELISKTETFRQRDTRSTVVQASGDGYAIGFNDSPERPLHLALELHKLINKYNKKRSKKDKVYIRTGIESGPVYFMRDLNDTETVWGSGIIMARRVMDLGEKMHILTSKNFADSVRNLKPEYKSIMHELEYYPVKWEGQIKIYNIYSEGKFGNKIPPTKPPEIPSQFFLFDRVELALDVKNLKNMMTHHTQTWTLINVSNEPRDIIHFNIDGDTPKNFADLNVSVKDNKGKKQKMLDLNAKNPLHKEFNVKLDKPIKPNGRKILKLEWDWEETNRNYRYTFATDCKNFKYLLYISKKEEIKQRVLKVNTQLGQKEYTHAPNVKTSNGKTIVSWQKTNAKAFESYDLQW